MYFLGGVRSDVRSVMGTRCVSDDGLAFDRSETEQSIPDRFARIVARYPDRLAVAAGGASLDFRALDAASNAVAHRILGLAGEAPEPVCLLVRQGIDLVTAILGTLKAGKIYLALDPRHPRPELVHFVEHSGARLFLCDAANEAVASDLAVPGQRVLNLASAGTAACGATALPGLAPDRPAYIFYTSGSTGTPKGVVDCHRNVLHNVMRYTNNLGIAPSDRLSMVQSCSFSGTVSSLFGALLNGAAIFPFDLQGLGIEAMAAWLAREQITIFHSVPTIFEQLSAVVPALPHLRLIRLEGDRCEPRHLARFVERFGPGAIVVNGLGATETGIVRQFFFRHGDAVPAETVPIGYPVTDMEVQLLGESGHGVADGDTGEIAVASRYLATGYWRRPDLTARAFRPDPVDPQRRVYRTGDLGRMRPGGCLEYLGRKDFQSKIRGVRIDLPEIESCLNRQPGIDRALIAVREDRPGAQQLVAYLTVAAGAELRVSVLRSALARSLPAIMVPARYVLVEGFPLDRNRKLDRRALPPPGRERPEIDTPFSAPLTDRQRAIASCFQDVLGLDSVGLNDDFFELGGDSLLATELLLLIDDRLDIPCPSDFLYASPTVAGLDRAFDAAARAGDLVALQPEGSGPALFCLHGTSGYVLEYRELARTLGPDLPVYGIQNREVMVSGRGHLPPGVEAMAAAAATEIRRAQPEGPYHLCGSCFGGVVAIETARRLRRMGCEVGSVGLIDTAFPKGTLRAYRPLKPMREYGKQLVRLPARQSIGVAVARFRTYLARIGRRGWKHLRFVASRHGRPLGFEHLALPDREARYFARAQFRLRPYDGPVTLFSAGLPDDRAEWQRAVDRLHVVEMGGVLPSERRPHLVSEPYVRDLARRLRAALDAERAQD